MALAFFLTASIALAGALIAAAVAVVRIIRRRNARPAMLVLVLSILLLGTASFGLAISLGLGAARRTAHAVARIAA